MGLESMRRRLMENAMLYNPELTGAESRVGHIKEYPVGSLFKDRQHCSLAGMHTPRVAGISGSRHEGAFSVCLSGGYKDDVDQGDFFIYTGTGGQEDSYGGGGNQVKDQTFDHKDNAALLKSMETGGPVRVIRGHYLHSKYAPVQGYRYDGLYKVEKAYMGKSKDGYEICQYELRRVPGQPPIPINPAYKS